MPSGQEVFVNFFNSESYIPPHSIGTAENDILCRVLSNFHNVLTCGSVPSYVRIVVKLGVNFICSALLARPQAAQQLVRFTQCRMIL
jgi:hypothetical protein